MRTREECIKLLHRNMNGAIADGLAADLLIAAHPQLKSKTAVHHWCKRRHNKSTWLACAYIYKLVTTPFYKLPAGLWKCQFASEI